MPALLPQGKVDGGEGGDVPSADASDEFGGSGHESDFDSEDESVSAPETGGDHSSGDGSSDDDADESALEGGVGSVKGSGEGGFLSGSKKASFAKAFSKVMDEADKRLGRTRTERDAQGRVEVVLGGSKAIKRRQASSTLARRRRAPLPPATPTPQR